MHTYTADQIDLCRQLYEKLGVNREPRLGETWYFDDERCCGLVTGFIFIEDDVDEWEIFVQNDPEICNCRYPIHPLYSHGEVLEMLRDIYTKNPGNGNLATDIMIAVLSDNILTALLKLAIEIREGK